MNKKANSYIVFDFETGGLDKKKGIHSSLVSAAEFAAIALRGGDFQELVRYDNIIKPYDENLEYQPQATEIHGLSKEYCEDKGIPLKEFMDDFVTLCKEANHSNSRYDKPILVAHNAQYDIQFIQDLASRTKVDLSKIISGSKDAFGNFQPHYIDTIDLCKIRWGNNEKMTSFSQQFCCDEAGIDLVEAHRAMPDVAALAQLFIYLNTSSSNSGQSVMENKTRRFPI